MNNNITEYKRIKENVMGEMPDGKNLQFYVTTKNGHESLLKVKEVIEPISLYDSNMWPSDEVWETILPLWFLKRIQANGVKEILKNPSLWHFGSWLDAMKYRGWKWFSSMESAEHYIIILEALELPYSVNPLEYVIIESGVNLSDIKFNP